MKESYRNLKHRREEEKGTPRRDITELYHLENISQWLQYIFWLLTFIALLVLGVSIRILVSYF